MHFSPTIESGKQNKGSTRQGREGGRRERKGSEAAKYKQLAMMGDDLTGLEVLRVVLSISTGGVLQGWRGGRLSDSGARDISARRRRNEPREGDMGEKWTRGV